MTDDQADRARVEQIARDWIGTPFHDHAELKGVGCDCATFLKGVFTEAGLVEPFTLDHYSPQFFLHSGEERYVGWVEKFAREIPAHDVKPGDIVLYKIGLCYAHGAVIAEPGWPTIIHAHYGSRCVRLDDGRKPRLGTRILGMRFFSLFAKKKSQP